MSVDRRSQLFLWLWQVDDLLQKHGIVLSGRDAVRLLTLRHPGLSLYPIDGEQLREGEVIVGAALLPCACGEDASEDGSGV